MGCILTSTWKEMENVQLSEKLTERQVELMRASWLLLCKDSDIMAEQIYNRLFGSDRLRELLVRLVTGEAKHSSHDQSESRTTTDRTDGDGVDITDTHTRTSVKLEQKLLKKHASVIVEALGAAVECCEDSMFLSGILVALGRIHANHHVKPRYLNRMWPPVRDALRATLQEQFTEEVEETWKIVFGYILSKMKEGIRRERMLQNPGVAPELSSSASTHF